MNERVVVVYVCVCVCVRVRVRACNRRAAAESQEPKKERGTLEGLGVGGENLRDGPSRRVMSE